MPLLVTPLATDNIIIRMYSIQIHDKHIDPLQHTQTALLASPRGGWSFALHIYQYNGMVDGVKQRDQHQTGNAKRHRWTRYGRDSGWESFKRKPP